MNPNPFSLIVLIIADVAAFAFVAFAFVVIAVVATAAFEIVIPQEHWHY